MPPGRLRVTLVLLGLAACDGPGPAPVPPAADAPPAVPTGTSGAPAGDARQGTSPAPAGPADGLTPEQRLARDQELTERMLRDYDRQAHAALDRFRARAFDPARDAGLAAAEGTIDVTVDGRTARYRFTFDGTRPDDAQVAVETLREDEGVHPGSAKQAKRYAVFATRGPYSFVVSYAPPVLWQVARAADGATLVVAPPHRSQKSVTYRIDGRDLVEASGASDAKNVQRTRFHWTERAGRALLDRAVEDDGAAVLEYRYADRDGVPLLAQATLSEAGHTYAAVLDWTRVVRR